MAMQARQLLEASNTLVIHADDRSTDFLKAIYEGMGFPVLSQRVTRAEIRKQIEAHDRLFMLGHGSPSGLFSHGGLIDDEYGPLLAQKTDGLYIWCNADAYAKRNKLTGLVSGMFISEVGEARMFGIEATQQEVDASNAAFAKAARECLDSGAPHATVRERYTSATCKITKFNNERLYVFDKGVPSPVLHPSSYAHREDAYARQREQDAAEQKDWKAHTRPQRSAPPELDWKERGDNLFAMLDKRSLRYLDMLTGLAAQELTDDEVEDLSAIGVSLERWDQFVEAYNAWRAVPPMSRERPW